MILFFWHHLLGAMLKKIAIFKVDIRSHGTIVFWASPLEGDVEKFGDFQSGKIRSHGSIFGITYLEAMLRKLDI